MRFDVPRARFRAIVLKMVMVAVVSALAAPMAAAATPLTHLDATLLLQAQGTIEPLLLVAGRLPEGTQLPAEIVLPVPPGIEGDVLWAGEVLGGPLEDDPEATPRYEVRDGIDVAVFQLTQSLTGQIEIAYPGGTSIVADDLRTGGFELVAPDTIGAARLAVAVPPGFEVASLAEGTLTSEGQGDLVYYYVERNDVATGDPLSFQLDYRGTPPPAGAVPASQPASSEAPLFLIVLIAGVLAGAVLLVLASRPKAGSVEEDDEVESPEEYEVLPADDEEQEQSAAEPTSAPATELRAQDAQDADGPEPASGASGLLNPKVLLIAAALLILALVLALNVAGGGDGQVGVTETSGTVVSQRISSASAENQVEYPLMIPCGCPPEAEALKMFDALGQVPGVGYAAFDTTTLVMQVGYDPAIVETGLIEERLRSAGYLP